MKKYNINLTNGLCIILFILCFSFGLGKFVVHAQSPHAKNLIDELMDAANMGQIARVKSLISSGVNVNAISKQGWTALTVATFDNRDEVTKYLIESGADVNLVGAYGTTALMNAASNANLEMVKLLLAKGADAKFQGTGLSVLMVAASAGNVEIVKLLLGKGADINVKNKEDGKTALFYAAHQGHINIVKLLLKHGADVNAVDNEGQSVLEYAASSNKETRELLKKHGAKFAL